MDWDFGETKLSVHYTSGGLSSFFLLDDMDLNEERELVRQAQKAPDAFA